MLAVLDEYTREALTVTVKPKMGNADVLEVLYPPFLKHGRPEFIRSDNGPEFVAEAFQAWLTKVGVKPIYIYPASPWENGCNDGSMERYVEKFSMLSGLQQLIKPKPSSESGSGSTTMFARIRR